MLKSKLARLGLRLRGDSMSIISSEIPENNDAIIDAILFLRCQAREEFATKEAIQRSLPDVKSLVLSQFHYVTQSPTLYDPSIQLSEEEKSNMEGEKKELQQSIKELKAELKVKEEQMSEIEVKLSTGWSKRAVKLKNFFSGWGS
ncbi:uncharacterized protein [Ptychodera flava]|uniref:uncharacterized protein n=1 Tax=Ptychodera flava TaxID=63121 RepID=UPI00396A836E